MEFSPNLTPQQIIEAGAFGGCYFGLDVEVTSDFDYSQLFEKELHGIDKSLYLSDTYNAKANKFKTNAGMDYQYWKNKGWIHEDDPYGWFEWYLKYNTGRRHTDDARQIKRWNDFCGLKGRWRRAIYKKIHQTGNWDVSPRIQQSLLHWGYQVNEADYQIYVNSLQ